MTLYLVATPIGHLGDFSLRAIETLKKSDYILCEDTRHSRILLDHYEIFTPLKSFHKFKEAQSEEAIIQDLKNGKTIALISDAGTPLIADPGESLVKKCQEENISLSVIPGACAIIAALVLSGFSPLPFQFIGFLPKKEQALKTTLMQALLYKGTTISYETPHRILSTLQILKNLSPKIELCIARELTKRYEECLRGTADELLLHFQHLTPKGEMVLLISGPAEQTEEIGFKEWVAYLEETFSLKKTEAIKLAAELKGLPKKEVYKSFFNQQENP